MASELDLEWFPFYWRDFDEGTRELTNEEAGAYMRLLSYQWRNGSIPADRSRAARITGEQLSAGAWEALQRKFVADGEAGRLVNVRMRDVRERQGRRHALRVAAGRAGGLGKAAANQRHPSNAVEAPPSNATSPTGSNAPTELRDKRGKSDTSSPTVTSSSGTTTVKGASRERRATRCPRDFFVSITLTGWVCEQVKGVKADAAFAWAQRELAKFKDYEFKTPRSDWEAAFRNWLRRCIEIGNAPSGATGGDERRRSQTLALAADLKMSRREDESIEQFEKRVTDANEKRLAAARRGPTPGESKHVHGPIVPSRRPRVEGEPTKLGDALPVLQPPAGTAQVHPNVADGAGDDLPVAPPRKPPDPVG